MVFVFGVTHISLTNVYLRDANGNVMAIYETINPSNTSPIDNIAIKEIPIYGSSRLGQYRPQKDTKKTALGQRIYEFSNHLGNVLVTLTDNKVPQSDGTYKAIVLSASDYYPFGMAMKERTFENSEYRYGFNGKENDTDLGDNIQDLGARFYSGVLGRMFSTDPMGALMCDLSVYQFAGNSPIAYIDYYGLLKHPTINLNALFGKPATKAPTAKSPSNPNAPNRTGTGTAWSPSGGTYAAMVTIGMFPYIPEPRPQIDVSNTLLTIESLKNIAMTYYGYSEGSWYFTLLLNGDDINEEISKHNETVLANRAAASSTETNKFAQINRNLFNASTSSFNVSKFRELHQKRFTLSEGEMIEYQNLEVLLKQHSQP